MPRAPRFNDAGYVHHVIARGNNKQYIFRDEYDFQRFCLFLNEAIKKHPVALYNYALLNSHFHLLLETKVKDSLSDLMESATKAYARYFNKKYNHIGHVFQTPFRNFVIEEERYFFLCSRYIDLNPVKAGIVRLPQQYRWSGYLTLSIGKPGILPLEYHGLYEGLGVNPEERQRNYQGIVFQNEVEDLDLDNYRSSILGNREFKRKIRRERV